MIFFCLLILNATINEIGPTRPRYIVNATIIFPKVFSTGVRLLVSPTVAVALTVSYITSIASALVTADSNTVEINMIMNDILTTATDLLTACFDLFKNMEDRGEQFKEYVRNL